MQDLASAELSARKRSNNLPATKKPSRSSILERLGTR
jgi:hypothetical protein